MLTPKERQGVLDEMGELLLENFPGVGKLVSRWVGRHALRVDPHQNFAIYANNVLRYCERYGWIEDPAVLLVLLSQLAATPRTPFGHQMPTVIARIAALKPIIFWTRGRAYDTCHLALELPLLNRETTRWAFEGFDESLQLPSKAARVLVVNGPPGSGKTYTGDFLRLLVGLHPNEHGVAELDFANWTGKALTPDVLTVDLARQMGTPGSRAEAEVSRLHSQRPERWAIDLAIWLAGEAYSTGKIWHLLLDNFHLSGVLEPTYIFIEQLAAALAGKQIAWPPHDPDMGPPLRLALLGYTRPLVRNALVRLEDIRPIMPGDLELHFHRYYTYKGWTVNVAEIARLVARYAPRLPALFPQTPVPPSAANAAPPRWKMRELAQVVLQDCAALSAGAPGPPATAGAPVPPATAGVSPDQSGIT
jgi:hypothetical protein